jgi:hypothetical protein
VICFFQTVSEVWSDQVVKLISDQKAAMLQRCLSDTAAVEKVRRSFKGYMGILFGTELRAEEKIAMARPFSVIPMSMKGIPCGCY